MIKWVSTKESLPEFDEDVIVAYSDEEICFNHRTLNPEVNIDRFKFCILGNMKDPIYWLRLPKLPNN